MPPIKPTEAALRPQAAAQFLGLSLSTLEADRRKRHLGIPYIRLGRRRVIYRPADLIEWLDSCCEQQGQTKIKSCPRLIKSKGPKSTKGSSPLRRGERDDE